MVKHAAVVVEDFCDEWIGWSLPPVGEVIRDHRWVPSPRGAYCVRCGQSVGPGEGTSTGCGACRKEFLPTDEIVRLDAYHGAFRDWIVWIKYKSWAEMGHHLGRELGRAVVEADVVDCRRAIVVPMPMPWSRRLYRGIDHAGTIAEGVASEVEVPVVRVLSKATGPTQLGVSKSERPVNARRGMEVRKRWKDSGLLEGLHVILVDDVRTSGSSLAAAARLLRPLGAEKIVAAVLAVADSRRKVEPVDVGEVADVVHS